MLSYHLSFFRLFCCFPFKNIPFSTLKMLSTYPLPSPILTVQRSSPTYHDYPETGKHPICRTRFNNNSRPISFGMRSEIYRTRLQFAPDFLSCSNERVRVDIRVWWKKIGPDFPETGKHPSCPNKRNRVRVDIRVRWKKLDPIFLETGKHPKPFNQIEEGRTSSY